MDNIKTKHVFSENNKVSIKGDNGENIWYPINFQWIPVTNLNDIMNH